MDVLCGIRVGWDRHIEHKTNPDRADNERRKLNVLRAVLEAYHAEANKPVIVDKCRGWIAMLEMAEFILGHKAKVIVPVRDVPDVLSSFEKLHRRQSRTGQTRGEAENYFQFQSIEGRCEFWMRPDQPVGLAVNRIHDALTRGFEDRMHFVRFANLTSKPRETLFGIYSFLGLPPFEHNFDHVEQVTREDDSEHGFEGLHSIRSRVEPVPSDWRQILGPGGQRYVNISSMWGG
jgi:sulfotransferase